MGFEEYLARFISSLLYSYSEEEIDKTNVESLSISRNSLSTKLKDIIIYRNSFLQHGLPFFVRFGLISNILMKLSLKEFNQFEVTDIIFYLQFVDSQKFPTIEELNEMRDHQLYAHELFKDKISLIMNKYLLSNFNDQVKSIIMNSLVSISKIYFCIELNDSIIGIYIDLITLIGNGIQQNQSSEKDDLNEKELKLKMSLSGLKVFMVQKNEHENNLNNTSFFDNDDNSSFVQKIKQLFTKYVTPNDNNNNNTQNDDTSDSQPNCIIDIDEIDGLIEYDRNKNFNITINNKQKIEDKLHLSLWQISSLASIIPGMIKFYKYYLTKHIKRPKFLLKRSQSCEVIASNNNNNTASEISSTNNTNNNSNNNNNNNVDIENYSNEISTGTNLTNETISGISTSENISNVDDGDDDFGEAWLFVHRCAIELNTDRYVSEKATNPIIGQFIPSFIKRNQYLKIWQSFKNKPFNPRLLYELDHTLTYHQITLFRYMTETLRKKWSRKPLGREDVYKAFEFINMDLPNLVMFFLKRSTASINFSKIITNLYIYRTYNAKINNEDDVHKKYYNYYISFSMINPNLSISIDKYDNININCGFSSFKLKDSKNNNIVESIENGTQGFNFLVSFYSQAYRVHNNIISKKIKTNNDGCILDDLTMMKISAMISNVIFFVSRNEFFNFLKALDIEKFLSILFPNNQNDDDDNDSIRKNQLEMSALFNINQSSPLDSLFEKIDIDFVMDSCRLTVLINDPFQLTFVFDKLNVQRQLQQLELENKQLSVNAKSKLTNNVRKIFRKSDLIFDILNANIIFGNSKIEKVIATEISVHTIFMIRQKKILVFISPLFFQSNWGDIKQIKNVLSELLNNIEQFKTTLTASANFVLARESRLILPECIRQIEISGGIPSITLSLDMPSSKQKLLTFLIDTITFDGFIDNFEMKASVNKITFEDLIEINNVNIDLKKKHFVFEKVWFSMFRTLSMMPKDLMTVLELSPLTTTFSFLMKTLSVDLSVDWIKEPIDYTVSNFGGYSDIKKEGKIFLKCYVNCINLCHKALVKNQEVSGIIGLDKSINIFVDFGDLELIFLHEIFDLAFNQEWHIKDVFPVDFVLDWQIKCDSLLIDEIFYAENALIYLQMSDVAFGGDVMIESMEIVHMKLDKKDPISVSFDLTRHYFSVAVNFDYVEVDVFRLLSLVQFFVHFPFHITHPLTLDVKIMPMTIGLSFDPSGKNVIHPTLSIYESIDEESTTSNNSNNNGNDETIGNKDDMIFVNLRSSLYFDGFNVSMSMEVHDFDVYYGDEKILSIPYIEVFGANKWKMNIPTIDSEFSSFEIIPKLLKTFSSIPKLSFETWNIQHSLIDILTTFEIGEIRCLFNRSLQLNIHQIFANFLNYELNLKCNMSMSLYSTWFVCTELMKIVEIKFQCLINTNARSAAAKALITAPIQIKFDLPSINCLKNFLNTTENKSIEKLNSNHFLTIINKTNLNFKTKFGEIPSQSRFVYSEFFDDDEFELSFQHGKIPIRGENFKNRGEMKVIFEHFDNELVLYLNELNQLKISYSFYVINKTETNFKIEYQGKKHHLKSKTVAHNIPVISGEFKINGQIVNLDKNGSCLFNHIYLVKKTKRSIVIKPECFIINECPFDIHINHIQYRRYSKSEVMMNFFNEQNATIESIVFPSQQIDFTQLKNKKFLSYKLKTVYDFDLSFVLRIQVIENEEKPENVNENSPKFLVFSPSVIIKSKIKNLLVSHDKLNCFPLSNDNDFAFSPHKKFISRVFLTTSENFGFCEIILNESESKKDKEKLIVLDSINDPRIVYPIVVRKTVKKYPYYNIEIIKVTPFVKVRNITGFNLHIHLPNMKKVLIEKDKTTEFDEFESSFNFTFSIEEPTSPKKIRSQQSKQFFNNFPINSKSTLNNNEVKPFLFNFDKICSQKVILTGFFLPIDISVINKFGSKTIVFSMAKTFPCRIINLSNYALRIENREFKPKAAYLYAPSHKVPLTNDSMSSLKIKVKNNTIIFASNPFCANNIGVKKIGVESFESEQNNNNDENGEKIEGNEETEPTENELNFDELFYDEEHKIHSGSMIREIVISESIDEIQRYKLGLLDSIGDDDENHFNFENKKRFFTFTFESFVNEILLSIFDESPSHNLLLRMKAFRFLVGQSSANSEVMLTTDRNDDGYTLNQLFVSLGNLEIRDFNRELVLATKEKKEFVRVLIKNAFSPFHIQEVSFSMKPFYFRFNLSTFSYMISAILHPRISKQNKKHFIFNEFEMDDRDDDCQSMDNFLTLLDDGLIEKVKIDPITVLFAFEIGQNISPDFPQLLRIVPSAKPFYFSMKKSEIDDVRFQKKFISSFKSIDSEMQSKSGKVNFLAKNASKFIFSLNIFGSPYALFERMFFKQFNTFSIFSFFFGFLENISDYIRSICHFFSGQENLRLIDKKTPVVWGFTSMFMCILNGLGIFFHCLIKDKNPIAAIWKLFFSGAGGVFDALCGIFIFMRSLFADDFDIERELEFED